MLEEMTATQFGEWQAYFADVHLSDDPSERLDMGFALVASLIANVNRARGQTAYTADQFMPKFTSKQETADVYTAMGRIAKRKPAKTTPSPDKVSLHARTPEPTPEA